MPEQHDPIDELARFGAGFGSATPGGDMPLSAADVRRRGDQIRHRRTALVAGGAALAVAAVAVPVFAVMHDGDQRSEKDLVTEDVPVLAESDLLRDADTEYGIGEKTPWKAMETVAGDGQATIHPCQQQKLSALGARSSFSRFFDWAGTEPTPGTGLSETIAEFDTADAARVAYETFTEWIVDCEGHIPDAEQVNVVPKGRTVEDVPGDADAVIYDLNWGPVPEEIDPYGYDSYINETGLVLQGNRIAVLAVTIVGQDYNWLDEEGGTPVERMIPTAAQRLLPGTTPDEPSDQPSAPATTETSGATTSGESAIPDDFPLLDAWPDPEADASTDGPSRDLEPLVLEACETAAADAAHDDRLLARYTAPEDYRTRQLTTYADTEEAAAAVDAIRQVYDACPVGATRDDGMTPNWAVRDTTAGDESFALLGWDEQDGSPTTFGDTLLVVRRGSAVLVVAHSGHGGNPQGRMQEAVDEIVQESSGVVEQMCAWTDAGC